MKVRRLIKELKKMNPEADVNLNLYEGFPVLFVLSRANDDSVVWLQDEHDCQIRREMNERIDAMRKLGKSDDEIFLDFVELGITPFMLERWRMPKDVREKYINYLKSNNLNTIG